MDIDKTKLKDSMGRPLTQGLFIDFAYDTKFAVYTWQDEDKLYNDVLYPSLKRLYLEFEDPTEYQFSRKYLLGWQHWLRLKENKALAPHFEEWKEELDIKIAYDAINQIKDMSTDNFQAAKWLADRNYTKRGAGRPSKAEQEKEKRIRAKIDDVFNADIARLEDYR